MILHLINMMNEAWRKRADSRKVYRQQHPPNPERFKVWGIRSNKRTHEDNKPK